MAYYDPDSFSVSFEPVELNLPEPLAGEQRFAFDEEDSAYFGNLESLLEEVKEACAEMDAEIQEVADTETALLNSKDDAHLDNLLNFLGTMKQTGVSRREAEYLTQVCQESAARLNPKYCTEERSMVQVDIAHESVAVAVVNIVVGVVSFVAYQVIVQLLHRLALLIRRILTGVLDALGNDMSRSALLLEFQGEIEVTKELRRSMTIIQHDIGNKEIGEYYTALSDIVKDTTSVFSEYFTAMDSLIQNKPDRAFDVRLGEKALKALDGFSKKLTTDAPLAKVRDAFTIPKDRKEDPTVKIKLFPDSTAFRIDVEDVKRFGLFDTKNTEESELKVLGGIALQRYNDAKAMEAKIDRAGGNANINKRLGGSVKQMREGKDSDSLRDEEMTNFSGMRDYVKMIKDPMKEFNIDLMAACRLGVLASREYLRGKTDFNYMTLTTLRATNKNLEMFPIYAQDFAREREGTLGIPDNEITLVKELAAAMPKDHKKIRAILVKMLDSKIIGFSKESKGVMINGAGKGFGAYLASRGIANLTGLRNFLHGYIVPIMFSKKKK